MILLFDLEEANTILSSLSDMDDFFLPKSVSRKDLYILVNKFACAMDLKIKEDGKVPIPNLFLDQFDASKLVEIYLTQVEIDYVICAMHAVGFEAAGYPENISAAASRVYNKVNAQFIDGIIDHPGNEVWEIIAPDKELLGRGG